MDANSIISAIGSLGFPVVMCFVLLYYLEKSEESHKAEIDALKTAINNNTLILTKLESVISRKEEHVTDPTKE